jgi:hypothetical protein
LLCSPAFSRESELLVKHSCIPFRIQTRLATGISIWQRRKHELPVSQKCATIGHVLAANRLFIEAESWPEVKWVCSSPYCVSELQISGLHRILTFKENGGRTKKSSEVTSSEVKGSIWLCNL